MRLRPLALVAFLCAAPASADEPPPAYETVVTASRRDESRAEAPIATQVIGRDEIESSGADTVAEALEGRAGIEIEDGIGGSGVLLQGLDPQYVLVLIDGVRVTGRVAGAIDLDRIPTENVERIEIVRGPASAMYGADALGGVVHIVTRRAHDPVEGHALASYGTRNAVEARGRMGVTLGAWDLAASAGFRRRDSYDLEPQDIATTGGTFDEQQGSVRAGWGRGALRTDATAEYVRRDHRGIDASGAGAVFDRRNMTETFLVSSVNHVDLTPDLRLGVRGGYSLFRDQYRSDQRRSDVLDEHQDTLDHLAEVSTQLDAGLSTRHRASAGLEGIREWLLSERLDGGESRRARGAVYAQDEWTVVGTPRLVLVPAARLDLDSQFGLHPTPKIAARFDLSDTLTVRASVGRGYRAPSFKELLIRFENPSAGYVVQGNPDLGPETAIGTHVAVEHDPFRWLGWTVSAFRNDVTDLIDVAIVGGGGTGEPVRYSYLNLASAHTQGVETTLRLGRRAGTRVELGYMLTDARDDTRDRPLAHRARHRGSVGLTSYQRALRFEQSVRVLFVGPRPFYADTDGDGVEESEQAKPYVRVDARVAKRIGPVEIFGLVENGFDEGHPDYLPIPPRSFHVGVSFTH